MNENLNGLKNPELKKAKKTKQANIQNKTKKHTLVEFKRPLSSGGNGYGFADEKHQYAAKVWEVCRRM